MKVTVVGKPELDARLNRVINRIGSLEPVFIEIGQTLKDFYSTQPFLSSGGVYGARWEPLSPAYKKEKERKYPGKGILVATGTMMDSFIFTPTPVSVTIENTTDYFAKHQKGEGVPQRISMKLDAQRVELVRKTASRMLKPMIAAAWD